MVELDTLFILNVCFIGIRCRCIMKGEGRLSGNDLWPFESSGSRFGAGRVGGLVVFGVRCKYQLVLKGWREEIVWNLVEL